MSIVSRKPSKPRATSPALPVSRARLRWPPLRFGKQLEIEVVEPEDAEAHERGDEHRADDRPAHAEFRQHARDRNRQIRPARELADEWQREATQWTAPVDRRLATVYAGWQTADAGLQQTVRWISIPVVPPVGQGIRALAALRD
jgi:hypothetical protein